MAQERDKLKDVLARLRSVERKLDVLIEAQGLEGKVREREAEDQQRSAEQMAEISDQMSRAYRR